MGRPLSVPGTMGTPPHPPGLMMVRALLPCLGRAQETCEASPPACPAIHHVCVSASIVARLVAHDGVGA